MKTLGSVTLSILVMFLGIFTLQTLWGWFIVPFGVMALSMAHAFGVCLVVSYFKIKPLTEEDKKRSYVERLVLSALFMCTLLLFGKIVTLFM